MGHYDDEQETGRPQGSPLHVGVHEDGGETLAVSLHFHPFPLEGWRPCFY